MHHTSSCLVSATKLTEEAAATRRRGGGAPQVHNHAPVRRKLTRKLRKSRRTLFVNPSM